MDSTMDSGDYVGLNVGGKIYRTSRTTLTRYPDSFFTAMLDGSVPSARDDQGNYLIDRDGKIFRHVLNYLRCGELVVPANFSEFGLLEREADFFLLQELKLSIKKPLSTREAIGLMFDNGNLFNTTRRTLLREEDSFFTKMLNGDVTVPRDSQGNYVMDRDGSHFHHVLQYLRDGGIFSTIESNEFDHLKKEAEYFQLKEFAEHVESVKSMQSVAKRNPRSTNQFGGEIFASTTPSRSGGFRGSIHFYFCVHSPSIAYASYKSKILQKQYFIGEGVSATAGVVNLQKITREEPATLRDILFYFKTNVGQNQTPQRQISANCTKLEFHNLPSQY